MATLLQHLNILYKTHGLFLNLGTALRILIPVAIATAGQSLVGKNKSQSHNDSRNLI